MEPPVRRHVACNERARKHDGHLWIGLLQHGDHSPGVPAMPLPSKDRNLSQLSHELTGRYGTRASVRDIQQDADLRIRILTHWPDARH